MKGNVGTYYEGKVPLETHYRETEPAEFGSVRDRKKTWDGKTRGLSNWRLKKMKALRLYGRKRAAKLSRNLHDI